MKQPLTGLSSNDPDLVMIHFSQNDRKAVYYFNVLTRDCKDGISTRSISFMYMKRKADPLEVTIWEEADHD